MNEGTEKETGLLNDRKGVIVLAYVTLCTP